MINSVHQHPAQVPMIYLVGVDHQIQHDGGTMIPERGQTISAFCNYFEAQAKELRITLIAEELSEDVIEMWHATNSTVQSEAYRLGLRHLFCDPTRTQRQELGINNDRDLREEYWLSCLNDYVKAERILFVCGAGHLETFHQKLTRKGLPALKLPEQFGIGLPPPILPIKNEAIIQELEL